MEINESRLTFRFAGSSALKFDDTPFYREHFNGLPGSKGVDILYDSAEWFVMLEIKNCVGQEADNRWRIEPNNKKINLAPDNAIGRDSLDIEIAQKVAMTIACLTGAATFGDLRQTAPPLIPFSDALDNEEFATHSKKLLAILFLEGQFGSQTRTKKMIMTDLQNSLRAKLDWLNCKVSVVDSSTYNKKIFTLA